jgi:ketosteroid isomerase-like protein
MSEENVKIVLRGFPLFEAEDFEGLTRQWHPDGRVTAQKDWPEPGPFEGRDAVIAQFRRLASDMGQHRFTGVSVLADDDTWVVVSFVWEVRGAASAAAVASKMAAAYRVEGNQVMEAHFRWTPEEALEIAGLSHSDGG